MAPQPIQDLRDYVEQVQATLTDPAERDRALAVVERELEDTLGVVSGYRNDAKLEQEGSAGSSDDDPNGPAGPGPA